MSVSGQVDPRFRRVREAFAENFAARGELGAAVHVTVDGTPVVDLWGGTADAHTGRPWEADTPVILFSSTKGVTATLAHVLGARGDLDLDAPVRRIWPEFAQAGKENVTARQLLNHTAGLPGVDEPLPGEALFDWSRMTRALAAQAPLWPPGTRHGYHAITFGFLVGEVLRRTCGRRVGELLAEEVSGPLGLDLWIGLPEAHENRVAKVRMAPLQREPSPLLRAMSRRGTLTWKAFMNPRGAISSGHANSRAAHAAELPSSNGIGSARGLCGLYTALACGGAWRGVRLVDSGSIREMGRTEVDGEDAVLLLRTRFGSGFMKSVDNRPAASARFGPNDSAFGHVGAGGSFGMVDPDARVAIAYVMNQLGHGVLMNDRGQSLVDAVYEALS